MIFDWRVAVAMLINTAVLPVPLHMRLADVPKSSADATLRRIPPLVTSIHLAFPAALVGSAHQPVTILGWFPRLPGFAQACDLFHTPSILKQALLVGVFPAGLVVLGVCSIVTAADRVESRTQGLIPRRAGFDRHHRQRRTELSGLADRRL